ncbi:MAG: GAF domain-containing protein [Chthonomonas sp.]|nr:GAF domain-containing protein [Chthonomonas sp.]
MSAARALQDDLLSLFVVDSVQDENGLQSYLKRVLQVTSQCFRTSGASIFLEEGGVYHLAAKLGPAVRTPDGAVIQKGIGLAGEAIELAEPKIVTDGERADIGSSLIVPLMDGGTCIGVLNMARGHDEPVFGEEDLRYAGGVAGQIALAVHNAKLFASAREYDRLKRLAEVGQMTAAIAHEIRNPLTGILGAAKMIQEAPELTEEMANIIELETMKLNLLCDEFLDFSRPIRLDPEDQNLGDVVRATCSLLESSFSDSEVALTVTNENQTKCIDRRRIEQVVRNLVLNGLQATPKGGTVSVNVFDWGFSVHDTGAGMSEEAQQKLFSPFFTTKPSGTGLGLSIVQKVVQAHGGFISVQSQEGVGTTFEVHLP